MYRKQCYLQKIIGLFILSILREIILLYRKYITFLNNFLYQIFVLFILFYVKIYQIKI